MAVTQVRGAVDDLHKVIQIMEDNNIPREKFHIHCDGALFAMMLPFVDFAPEVSFNRPIDSMTVSGHKMLGCPMPCGIALTRKEHVKKVEQRIDYLNSVDTTIMGSRNGQAALFLWHALRKKGIDGIKEVTAITVSNEAIASNNPSYYTRGRSYKRQNVYQEKITWSHGNKSFKYFKSSNVELEVLSGLYHGTSG